MQAGCLDIALLNGNDASSPFASISVSVMQLDACIDPRGVGGSLDIRDITVLDMCSSGSGISDVLLSQSPLVRLICFLNG